MSANDNKSRMYGSFSKVCVVILLATIAGRSGYSQASLNGPLSPPPKLSMITSDHNPNEGWIGRAGGVVYTMTNITLANSTTVYWGMRPDSIKLSMDGSVYDSSEVLVFDTSSSDLAGGICVWTGSTDIPIEGGSPRPLLSKFVITVTDQADSPLSLTEAVSIGLPVNTGGVLQITGNTMLFKIKVEMFVSDDGGTTYIPHLDYYDAAPTPVEAISAYSSYSYGFWWENDPPELDIKLDLNVDENDTAIISGSILRVNDVEGSPSSILFIINPDNSELSLQYGKIVGPNNELAPGDTFTMEDINNGLISFVHNGSESTHDSISFMVVDSAGAKYMNGEDSVFYLIVNINPVDDPPGLTINVGMTLDEAQTLALSDLMLRATDPESNDSVIVFTLDPLLNSELPVHGLLKLNNLPLSDGATFTQADIINGKLVYQHDGSESVLDGFVFQVADEYGHLAKDGENTVFLFEITISPVNDIPVIALNEGMTLNEEGNHAISNSMLQTNDIESNDSSLIYTLDPAGNSDFPVHGILKLNQIPLSDGSTFTQSDINNGKVEYQHDGSESLLDGFIFRVADKSGAFGKENESTEIFFEINIVPVNDPPVFTKLSPITVNQNSEVIISSLYLGVTDAESGPEDITFTLDPDQNVDHPTAGTLKLNGVDLLDGQTFTMADINDSLVSYVQNGNSNESDFFVFAVSDADGAFIEDAGFTLFHFNFIIDLVDAVSSVSESDNLFELFPNPVKDLVNIRINNEIPGEVHLVLFNMMGEKIWEMRQNALKDYQISFNDYPAGLYYMKAEINNKFQTVKFIKR